MPTVETALGPIDAAQLGFTLSHEHVMTSAGEDTKHYPWLYDLDRSLERAIANLREVKAGGVDTIIDLTTPDLARDVRFIEAASRGSGMQVVVATGMALARSTRRAIHSPRKVANDEEGISPAHVNVLRAAARARARTGCPISTHHWAKGEQGREQLRIFLEEGAPVDRICIGHSADTTDVDYLVSLLEAGVWLSMDRYPGRPGRPGWEERNATVKALVDRGWAHRIMLGHDASATRPVPAGMTEPPSDGYNPDGMLHLTRTALPALLASGVSQADVDTMMRDVPRRFLAGE